MREGHFYSLCLAGQLQDGLVAEDRQLEPVGLAGLVELGVLTGVVELLWMGGREGEG